MNFLNDETKDQEIFVLNLSTYEQVQFEKQKSVPKKIEKKPITLVICKNCELVQLGHNFNLKYLIHWLKIYSYYIFNELSFYI